MRCGSSGVESVMARDVAAQEWKVLWQGMWQLRSGKCYGKGCGSSGVESVMARDVAAQECMARDVVWIIICIYKPVGCMNGYPCVYMCIYKPVGCMNGYPCVYMCIYKPVGCMDGYPCM